MPSSFGWSHACDLHDYAAYRASESSAVCQAPARAQNSEFRALFEHSNTHNTRLHIG